MKNQSKPQSSISILKKKERLIFLSTITIIAFLSGLSVYFWQQSSISNLKEELANQRLQIQQLQEKTQNTASELVQPTTIVDAKTLHTLKNIEQYNNPDVISCDVEFNHDKPSTTVTYLSQQRGLSIELPYNPNWGNDNPYDEYDNSIWFGYTIPLEACNKTRSNKILFKLAKTIEETQTNLSLNSYINKTLQKIKLSNNLTGFKYIDDEFGYTYAIEVVGDKFNYKISQWPSSEDSEKEFAIIETIANSINLIK